jgi:hypothetical protein
MTSPPHQGLPETCALAGERNNRKPSGGMKHMPDRPRGFDDSFTLQCTLLPKKITKFDIISTVGKGGFFRQEFPTLP